MTVWSRPYVDRPVGDASVADEFAVTAAARLGLGAVERVRVGMNALYRCGDVVLRVGRPSAPGRLGHDLAVRLLELGIPVASPVEGAVYEHADLVATAWHRVESVDAPTDWAAVGAIVRRVHSIVASDLPAGYPMPSPVTFPWWDFDALLDDVAADIDAAARSGLSAAIEAHRDWSAAADTDPVVCHGDVHPGNVLMTAHGPVLLDWDLLCCANRAWDHAMLTTLATRWGGDPQVYPMFASGYGESLADEGATLAFATLRNVAATLLRVRAGRVDPSARDEADRRLRSWRGEVDAPRWTAQ